MAEQVIEYAPQGIGEGIVMTRSSAGVSFEIKPDLRRLLWWIAGRTAFWGALTIFALGRVLWERDWGALLNVPRAIALAIFVVLYLSELFTRLGRFLPMTLTVKADEVELRWRMVSKMMENHWDRRAIVGVRAGKTRIRNRLMPLRGLILGVFGKGDVMILSAPRRQVEKLAKLMRVELGLAEEAPAFVGTPAPQGCRWRCVIRGGQAVVAIGPLHEGVKWWAGAVAGAVGMGAGWYGLRQIEAGWWAAVGGLVWGVVIGFVAFGLVMWSERLRRRTTMAANAGGLMVVETGLLSPINMRCGRAEITGIEVGEDRGKRALRIGLVGRPDLLLLRGRREADLVWLRAVMGDALKWNPLEKVMKSAGRELSVQGAAPGPMAAGTGS